MTENFVCHYTSYLCKHLQLMLSSSLRVAPRAMSRAASRSAPQLGALCNMPGSSLSEVTSNVASMSVAAQGASSARSFSAQAKAPAAAAEPSDAEVAKYFKPLEGKNRSEPNRFKRKATKVRCFQLFSSYEDLSSTCL